MAHRYWLYLIVKVTAKPFLYYISLLWVIFSSAERHFTVLFAINSIVRCAYIRVLNVSSVFEVRIKEKYMGKLHTISLKHGVYKRLDNFLTGICNFSGCRLAPVWETIIFLFSQVIIYCKMFCSETLLVCLCMLGFLRASAALSKDMLAYDVIRPMSNTRTVMTTRERTWPFGRMPYTISDEYSNYKLQYKLYIRCINCYLSTILYCRCILSLICSLSR